MVLACKEKGERRSSVRGKGGKEKGVEVEVAPELHV